MAITGERGRTKIRADGTLEADGRLSQSKDLPMDRSSPTAPRKHWAEIVLPGVTKADREVIEKARTAVQRSRDLLAEKPLMDS